MEFFSIIKKGGEFFILAFWLEYSPVDVQIQLLRPVAKGLLSRPHSQGRMPRAIGCWHIALAARAVSAERDYVIPLISWD